MSASESATTVPTIRDILGDEELALLFREFLHQLQCAENLSFYVEVEDYKRLPTAVERTERAEKVWSKYFGKDSTTPLNVDAKCRQRLDAVIQTGNIDIFEEASEFAFSSLSLDCYRKFIASEMFTGWLGTSFLASLHAAFLYRRVSIDPSAVSHALTLMKPLSSLY